MAWDRKVKITIDSAKVEAALTDFTVLLTEDNLPAEMFDADGDYPARNDGGDLRFYTDSACANEIAREIRLFNTDNNPANGYALIAVNIPSLSGSTDAEIWCKYHNPTATDYIETDTYGVPPEKEKTSNDIRRQN